MKRAGRILILVALAATVAGLSGCKRETEEQKTKRELKEAWKDFGHAVKETAKAADKTAREEYEKNRK